MNASTVSTATQEQSGYLALGLRCNPFATQPQDPADISIHDRDDYNEFISGTWDILEVLGESGAGKSTFLYWLQQHSEQQGLRTSYHYIECSGYASSPIDLSCDFLLLDEIERLGPRHLQHVLSAPVRMAVATHSGIVVAAPIEKKVKSIVLGLAPPLVMKQMLTAALVRAGADEAVVASWSQDLWQAWYESGEGNFHAVDRVGYEVFQTCSSWEAIVPDAFRKAAALLWHRVQIQPSL